MPSGPTSIRCPTPVFSPAQPERPGAQLVRVLAQPRDPAAAAHEPRLLARGVEVQVGVVGVGRHGVLREHEPVRAHVAHVAGRVREPALAALVQRRSARLRMVGGRSAVGAGSSSGPSSASAANGCVRVGRRPARAEPELAGARQVGDVRARALRDDEHGEPVVAGDQRVRVAVGGMPEQVVDADRVRARRPRARTTGSSDRCPRARGTPRPRRRGCAAAWSACRGRSRSARRRAAWPRTRRQGGGAWRRSRRLPALRRGRRRRGREAVGHQRATDRAFTRLETHWPAARAGRGQSAAYPLPGRPR